jgi:hypothetical protein
MSTGSVTVRLNLNSAGYSAEMAKAERQMKQLQAATGAMGQRTVSSMQAASASIRLLEGGMTNNIRAAERFISLLPSISGLLEKAFPFVGAAALGGVFIRIGAEVAKYVQKLNEVPQNPFTGMIASARVANDAIAVTNDRLQMEIEKLEHKPVNGMALALDEARQASDKLIESLDKSNKAFTEAMGKMNVSRLQGLWQNTTPTAQADQNIAKARAGVQQVLADHQPTIDDALASGNQENVRQAREALMKDLQDAYAVQDKALRAGLVAAQQAQANFKGSYSVGSDPSTVIQKYSGALQQSAQDQMGAGGQYGESLLRPQKDQLEVGNAAQEAAKRAQEAIVAQWRKSLDEQKTTFNDVNRQEAQFWVRRMEEARKGSLSYIEALDEANKSIARLHTENIEKQAEFDKNAAGAYLPDSMDLSRGDNGEMASQGRDTASWLKTLNEGITLRRQSASAIAEASQQMDVMTGRMSKLDAAQQTANRHAQEFADSIDRINAAIANAQDLPAGLYKQQTLAGLDNQRGQLTAGYQIQSATDQRAVNANTVSGAQQDSLNQMTQSFNDLAANLKQIIPQMVQGLNSDLVKLMTGHGSKADFGKTFTQAGQGLLNASLQKVEGIGLKALGLGKADGSRQNPFYTIAAAGMGAPAGINTTNPTVTAGVDMAKLIPGTSFIQPFLGPLVSMIPHLAGGGDFMANHPMLVGEAGPEIINPGFSGSVTPNSAIGGGGDIHHWHIDARGATDPEAVNAAIMRAAPSLIAASVQAVHHATNRKPQGR